MKRLLMSVAGGFVLPIVVACITGPLSTYTEDRTLRLLLDIPTGWPRILYFRFGDPLSQGSLSNNETLFFVFIIGCDILLYAILTYVALSAFSMLRRKGVEYGQPPPPPRF